MSQRKNIQIFHSIVNVHDCVFVCVWERTWVCMIWAFLLSALLGLCDCLCSIKCVCLCTRTCTSCWSKASVSLSDGTIPQREHRNLVVMACGVWGEGGANGQQHLANSQWPACSTSQSHMTSAPISRPSRGPSFKVSWCSLSLSVSSKAGINKIDLISCKVSSDNKEWYKSQTN